MKLLNALTFLQVNQSEEEGGKAEIHQEIEDLTSLSEALQSLGTKNVKVWETL